MHCGLTHMTKMASAKSNCRFNDRRSETVGKILIGLSKEPTLFLTKLNIYRRFVTDLGYWPALILWKEF